MWINQLLSSLYIFYQTLTCTHTILYVCHFLYSAISITVHNNFHIFKIKPSNFHGSVILVPHATISYKSNAPTITKYRTWKWEDMVEGEFVTDNNYEVKQE